MNPTKINILVAYPYFCKPIFRKLTERRSEVELIIDSGAFSAWNTGRVITLDEYCRFLESIESLRPFWAVQLDVFGDPDASWRNFEIMQRRGFTTMPVFTRGESMERLEEMYAATDYIMFGGIVIGGKNKNYVKWFLNRNHGRRCHWLGFVNMDFIKCYRPTSVDSSSWFYAARSGKMALYKGAGEVTIVDPKVILHGSKIPQEIVRCMYKVGASAADVALLQHQHAWHGNPWREKNKGMGIWFSAAAHILRAYEVEKNLGTKIYLACQSNGVRVAFEVWDYFRKVGIR